MAAFTIRSTLVLVLCFFIQMKLSVASTNGECRVSRVPTNGFVSFAHDQTIRLKANEKVPSGAAILYRCKSNHHVVGSGTSNICLNGEWLGEEAPECLPRCSLTDISSITFTTTCKQLSDGRSRIVRCDDLVEPGIRVSVACKTGYQSVSSVDQQTTCLAIGQWSQRISPCRQVCGEEAGVGSAYIVGGVTTNNTKVPWHVSIYRKSGPKKDNELLYTCGGTIINSQMIVSAIHCFWDGTSNRVNEAIEYLVVTGKFYRKYGHPEEEGQIQTLKVKEIHYPNGYNHVDGLFTSDVAVLILDSHIEFKAHVAPACINYHYTFDEKVVEVGSIGRVAGWGLTDNNGNLSDELKSIEMPVVSRSECRSSLDYAEARFLTNDKFCAGYLNLNLSVCEGDSGGGLVFPQREGHKNIYYLRGIVSSGSNKRGSCDPNKYSFFINTAHFADLIQKYDSRECEITDMPANLIVTSTGNGKALVVGDSVSEGGFVDYKCARGWTLEGNNKNFCRDMNWALALPTCKRRSETRTSISSQCGIDMAELRPCNIGDIPGSGFTVAIPRQLMINDTHVMNNGTVVYRCEGGMTLNGDKTNLCFDGGWENSGATCERKADSKTACRIAESPAEVFALSYDRVAKTFVKGTKVGIARNVEFKCGNRWTSAGNDTSLCKGGIWTGNATVCDGFSDTSIIEKDQQFTCDDQNIIDATWKCDGLLDCPDGSDETLSLCQHVNCDAGLLRCAYGACVDDLTQCVHSSAAIIEEKLSKGGCRIDRVPTKGFAYRSTDKTNRFELGDVAPHGTTIAYSCLKERQYHDHIEYSRDFTCKNGSWSQSYEFRECVTKCNGRELNAYAFHCNEPSSCYGFAHNGIDVGENRSIACRGSYRPLLQEGQEMVATCGSDGLFIKPWYCQPICGEVLNESENDTVVADPNALTKRSDAPWHVNIYRDSGEDEAIFICGGTILNVHLVVSAARCFYDQEADIKKPADNLFVSIGKFHRRYGDPRDKNTLRHRVKEIHHPAGTFVLSTHASSDVAVLLLERPIFYGVHVTPICLDYKYRYDERRVPLGSVGRAAGWGLTDSGEVLQTMEMPVVECPKFDDRIDDAILRGGDRFCLSVKLENLASCNEAAGSGVVFPQETNNKTVYFLRGIVSFCTQIGRNEAFAFITNTAHHYDLIWQYDEPLKAKDGNGDLVEPSKTCVVGVLPPNVKVALLGGHGHGQELTRNDRVLDGGFIRYLCTNGTKLQVEDPNSADARIEARLNVCVGGKWHFEHSKCY